MDSQTQNYQYNKSSFTTLDNNSHKVTTKHHTAKEIFHQICQYCFLGESALLLVQSLIEVCSFCINESFIWTQVMSSFSFVIILSSIVLLTGLQIYQTFGIKIQKFDKIYDILCKKEIIFMSYFVLNQLVSICINHVSRKVQITALTLHIINFIINNLNLIDYLIQRKQDKIKQIRGVNDMTSYTQDICVDQPQA